MLSRAWPLSLLFLMAACGGTSALDAGLDASRRDASADAAAPRDAGRDDAGPLPPCGDDTPLALASCVDEARYTEDLVFVATERVPETAHWMAVQDRCASTLEGLGFTVERHAYGTGVNVIGTLAGTSEPDRRVLVGAHYDHIEGCDGADDNASGVAGALEAARVLARRSYPRTLVVGCWDEEERGLIGSTAYVAREVAAARTFDLHLNFEMIGYYDDTPNSQRLPVGFGLLFPEAIESLDANQNRGDFIALIGDILARDALTALADAGARFGLPTQVIEVSARLKNDPLLRDLRRSDHAPFWEADIPAVMLTDTSEFRYDAYHCRTGDDVVANLDPDRASRVVAIAVAAAAAALGL